jgi:hypothetical protein
MNRASAVAATMAAFLADGGQVRPAAVRSEPPCLPAAPKAGVGTVDLFHLPVAAATELNDAAKTLYRQGKWEEARAQYRAALVADPDFLAPHLNIACSFVRQERFAEATAETRALLDRAYVPWAREVLEAADMGALKVRPEMGGLRDTLAEAARKWGDGLAAGVVFVARQRPPLRVPPTGEGVFLLNPHQEAYAFLPETGLFRQLTAEDGRVIALVRSADRRRITYVTAEKLVRNRASGEVALRGVAIGELTLSTMASAPPLHVEGDVRKLGIAELPAGFVYEIASDRMNGWYRRDSENVLTPSPRPAARGSLAKSVRVTPQGVSAAARREPAGCAAAVERAGPGGLPQVIVEARAGGSRILGEKLGAGLAGLPLP